MEQQVATYGLLEALSTPELKRDVLLKPCLPKHPRLTALYLSSLVLEAETPAQDKAVADDLLRAPTPLELVASGTSIPSIPY